MVFSFNTAKKKESIVAIFDIGSGSVGGALARIPSDASSLPTIIASVRTNIVARDTSDFSLFFEDMQKALNSTAELISTSKVGAPDSIACFLASPWYLSETRVITYVKDHPFIFTKRLADELFQKEVLSLQSDFDQKYQSPNNAPEVIEHRIMGVSLNGYAVDDPMGKRSKMAEMNMIISLSPKICLDSIRRTVSKHLPHLPLSFSSFALSSFIAVRDRFVTPDTYLLLDIGGEVTDVAIVTKGILKASLSFPFGKKTFFRMIEAKLKIEERDAEELFNLYTSGNLAARRKKKMEPIFKSIEESWGEAFRACVGTLPHTLVLPHTVFLTADLNVLDWFAGLIRTEPYMSSLALGNTCTVVTLEGPDLLSMCSIKESSCDPFLMIEAISIMRKNI